MTKDLEQQLYRKYPALFAQRHLSIRASCMPWGICTGNGWFDILVQMCQKIQDTGVPVQFTQVKEKFGTLTVYLSTSDDVVNDIVRWAARLSQVTCEECGQPGRISRRGWLSVRCSGCRKQEATT